MTLRERLRTIGQAIWRPEPSATPIAEIKTEKGVFGTSVDLFASPSLVTTTKASDKLLKANTGWVYKNNDVVAKEVAGIEFELFNIKQVGKEVVFDPILQHPLLDALDRFNEFTSASDGFYTTQSHKSLAGDAFWYVDTDGVEIRGIYILPPDKVTLKLGKPAPGQRIIQFYEYKDSVEGEQIAVNYAAKDVVHFKNPNPENPYRGKSKVEAAAEAIDTDNYAIEANKGQFKRGMINNFILSTDSQVTDEQIKRLEAKLRSKHQGASNAYSTLILSGGLKPESITMSSRDMEFIAQQTWLRDKIMSIFGNNRAVLGITDDVNRSNAESTILNWKRTTIKSEMKAITDTLNEFFVPRYGSNLLLGFKDPVPEDKVEKTDVITKLKNGDIISTNEAREEIGYDPIDGGDEMGFQRQERQMADQARIAEQVARTAPKSIKNITYMKHLRRTEVFEKVVDYIKLKEAAIPVAKKMLASRKTEPVREHSRFTNDQVWAFHNKQIRVVEAQEDIFENKVLQYINGLVERALANLPAELPAMQRKALINETDELVQATIDFTPILTEVAVMSGIQALQFIGDDDPYIPTDLRAVIERSVNKFATSLIATDKDLMIDIISDGVKNGDSMAKISKAIKDKFAVFSKTQARTITRTEVIRASNFGALDAWKRSKEVVAKQWLTAMDDRVDPLCEYMNGKIMPTSKNFFDKGESLAVGDHSATFDYGSVKVPPLHPNCRCTLLPVLKGQASFDAAQFLRIKGLETDKAELEQRLKTLDVQSEEYKTENDKLQSYIDELEEYLHV